MEKCPKCHEKKYVKSGILKGRQRYLCKMCGCQFSVESKRGSQPEMVKRMALNLYLEGLGFRAISRILKVSHVAVFKWIRSFGEQVISLRSQEPARVIEIDELHTYIGKKKELAGFGLRSTAASEEPWTLWWVTEPNPQEKNSGKKLNRSLPDTL
jgi:transposase-like protein